MGDGLEVDGGSSDGTALAEARIVVRGQVWVGFGGVVVLTCLYFLLLGVGGVGAWNIF